MSRMVWYKWDIWFWVCWFAVNIHPDFCTTFVNYYIKHVLLDILYHYLIMSLSWDYYSFSAHWSAIYTEIKTFTSVSPISPESLFWQLLFPCWNVITFLRLSCVGFQLHLCCFPPCIRSVIVCTIVFVSVIVISVIRSILYIIF